MQATFLKEPINMKGKLKQWKIKLLIALVSHVLFIEIMSIMNIVYQSKLTVKYKYL